MSGLTHTHNLPEKGEVVSVSHFTDFFPPLIGGGSKEETNFLYTSAASNLKNNLTSQYYMSFKLCHHHKI